LVVFLDVDELSSLDILYIQSQSYINFGVKRYLLP
jgi:hypothetical protein